MLVLFECSAAHYDHVCKVASKEGGFLYGMKNCADFKPDCKHSLTWHQLDTLAKIVEVGSYLEIEKAKIALGIGITIRRIFALMEDATPAPVIYSLNVPCPHLRRGRKK